MPSFKMMLVGALAVTSTNASSACDFFKKDVFAWGVVPMTNTFNAPHYALLATLTPTTELNPTIPTSYFLDEGFAKNVTEFTFNGHTEKVSRITMENDLVPINFIAIPKQIFCNGTYAMMLTTYCGANKERMFCDGSAVENAQFLAMAQILYAEARRNNSCPVIAMAKSELTSDKCEAQFRTMLSIFTTLAVVGCVATVAVTKCCPRFFKACNKKSPAKIENGESSREEQRRGEERALLPGNSQ